MWLYQSKESIISLHIFSLVFVKSNQLDKPGNSYSPAKKFLYIPKEKDLKSLIKSYRNNHLYKVLTLSLYENNTAKERIYDKL